MIQFVISKVTLAADWGGDKEWRQGTLLEDCCSHSVEVNQEILGTWMDSTWFTGYLDCLDLGGS